MYSARIFFALCTTATFDGTAQGANPARRVTKPDAVAEPALVPLPSPVSARTVGLLSTAKIADVGFFTGLRFANLGGRREIFAPLPQGDITPSEIILTFDYISAHEARRNLEVLVNDRSAIAIALDGHATGGVVRVRLPKTAATDRFVKLDFLYSGAGRRIAASTCARSATA